MSEIDLKLQKLAPSIQEILLEGEREYRKGDYQRAYRHFQDAINAEVHLENLWMLAGNCLLNLGQGRLARWYILQEALEFPENQVARQILSAEYDRINGKITTYESDAIQRPASVPSISLVMIVKNEEETLPRCLESFKDIVQEIIVVDTGSTDRTVEIAKSYGARVEFFPWCNDFAAARNESLKYATCDWILRTDADEYIEEDEKAKLLDVINSGCADIYICPTICSLQSSEDVVSNVRLIRNHLGVRYDYPIHETVAPSAVQLGLRQAITNVRFQHTGYDLEEGEWNEKVNRNLRICDQALTAHPDDSYIRLVKGCLLANRDKPAAIHEFQEALKVLPEETMGVKYLGIAYYILADYYEQEKKETALHAILMNIQSDFMAVQSMMQFLADFYLYRLNDRETALKLYVWASERIPSHLFDDTLLPEQYNLAIIQEHLLELSVLQKDQRKASEFTKKIHPKVNEKKQRKDRKDIPQSLDDAGLIDLLEKEENLPPDLLRRAANAYLARGEFQKAYMALIHAGISEPLTSSDLLELALYQIQLNHPRFAQGLIKEAQKMGAEEALVVNAESILAVREGNDEQALEKSVLAFVLQPGNSGFQHNVEQLAGKLGMNPIQALKKTGLKWLGEGNAKNGAFALMLYSRFQPDDREVQDTLSVFMKGSKGSGNG